MPKLGNLEIRIINGVCWQPVLPATLTDVTYLLCSKRYLVTIILADAYALQEKPISSQRFADQVKGDLNRLAR